MYANIQTCRHTNIHAYTHSQHTNIRPYFDTHIYTYIHTCIQRRGIPSQIYVHHIVCWGATVLPWRILMFMHICIYTEMEHPKSIYVNRHTYIDINKRHLLSLPLFDDSKLVDVVLHAHTHTHTHNVVHVRLLNVYFIPMLTEQRIVRCLGWIHSSAANINMCTHAHIYVYIYNLYMHIFIYTYIHMYMNIYIYTYVYK